MRKNSASFRDSSGSVYEDRGNIYRLINQNYADNWEYANQSGLLEKAIATGSLIPFKEVPMPLDLPKENVYKILDAQRVPFISYPYEWSFSQLKDAAILTLELQRLALEHGAILKDASAYNIQFLNGKPIFIDLLSFEKWADERPWEAYGQFCRHFLAPLALRARLDSRCAPLAANWIDGIPLDMAAAMLPASARLSPGLYLHLFMHSKMQTRHADARQSADKVRKVRMSRQKMLDLTESLENTIKKLDPSRQNTEWADYYEDTNYNATAMEAKTNLVKSAVEKYKNELSSALAIDLGANDGHFTSLLGPHFETVLALDIDPTSVDRHYRNLKGKTKSNILPLIMDLTAPSPPIGWALKERESFLERARSNMLLALALCHHLHFTGGIPFDEIAAFFNELLKAEGILIVEFVPLEDSQVKRLLAARDVDTSSYTLERFIGAFEKNGFMLLENNRIVENERNLLVFKKVLPD